MTACEVGGNDADCLALRHPSVINTSFDATAFRPVGTRWRVFVRELVRQYADTSADVKDHEMQFVSADEMARLKQQLEDLRRSKIDVQDRITKAAALGDLSENAEYHFAKEENRSIEGQIRALGTKIQNAQIVTNDALPDDMVFLGHTVKLLDLSDETEQLVRLVGEATGNSTGEVLEVTASSPLGEALMKARVGEKISVRAPRGSMEFKILEIV
jgi:transcription elongation factor GreA